jgi:glycosyltransferase involved in cell wall biosynthesis
MAKGLAELLAIAQRVNGVRLTLIGQAAGKREQRYMEFFRDERIADRVTLTGQLPNGEVLDILAKADVYCLPSHTEGFPMSIMEAMQAGLPVVASTVGAIPDMVDVPRGGILCAPHDDDGFVAAIEHLRDSPVERREMGNYNRAAALRKYDYDAVVRRLADVYLRAASG